ncbi:MAG: tetratricopeptide repeat protein [Pseudomonadota bacterium]|nr:tetratricopeptide repeat protein [Pseudomonadota bacterium]
MSLVLALLVATAGTHAYAADRAGPRRPIRAAELTPTQADANAQVVAATRLEAIARLEDLIIRDDFSTEQRAEMRLRLAERYLEQARYLHLAEMAGWQAEYDRCFNTPGCDPAALKEADFHVASAVWFEKGIRVYRRILADTPTYARADEAQFYLGYALREVGRVDDGNEAFTRLVKTVPTSAFVADAYLLIGEYWFDKSDAYKALLAYQRASAFPEHDKYLFSLYKLAWCYYNVGAPEEALASMRKVVKGSMEKANAEGAPTGAIQLQEESLRDLTLFYADLGDLGDAETFLAGIGRTDLVPDLLDRAASRVFDQGKFELAITTWRRLLASAPQSPKAPAHHARILEALRKVDRKDDVLQELARYRDTYAASSAWARANVTRPEALAAASETLEVELRRAATDWHAEARKLRTGAAAARVYALAEQAYGGYLAEFGVGAHAYEVRYGYAELLYAVGKHDQAYTQYTAVVTLDPKGSRARFCAESAIFAAEQMVKREPKVPVVGATPVPLTTWEANQLAALDQYAALFSDDKTRDIVYRSGWLLYGKNHFAEASERFNVVIAMDPKSREAEQAANLMLDSFALVEDWASLQANAKRYRDQVGLGSPAFKGEVATIYENAALKAIDARYAKDGDTAVAAAAYLAWVEEFPASQNGELALHNASVHLTTLGDTRGAIAARESLVSRFPRSARVPDAVAALGFGYESVARFDQAATWYERLATSHPTHKDAADACSSAALFRGSLGQWEVAVADYQRYLATWPDRPDAQGVRLAVAGLYEAHGKPAEAAAIYQRFYAKPAPAATVEELLYARLHYGLQLGAIGHDSTRGQAAKVSAHWRESLVWFDNIRSPGPGVGATPVEVGAAPAYAAQMRFALAEEGWAAYQALAIDGPAGRELPPKQVDALLRAQLLAKVRGLADVEKAYTAVMAPGSGEWAMAAAARIGAAHEELSRSLATSYIPAWLTEDQKELYRMGLEDRIYQENQKAAAAYVTTLATARRLSVYNTHTADAVRRLGVLQPDEHPVLTETLLAPRFLVTGSVTGGIEEL